MNNRRDRHDGPDDTRQYVDNAQARARDAKRAALITDIAGRIRRVCEHLTTDEFAQLVEDMADTRLRFAAIEAGSWPRRGEGHQSVDGPGRAAGPDP